MRNKVRVREVSDDARRGHDDASRKTVVAGRDVAAQGSLMDCPPSVAAEQVSSPGVSLEIEALEAFVAQRPWLADVFEREIHRLWGGRAEFGLSQQTGEALIRAIGPLPRSTC